MNFDKIAFVYDYSLNVMSLGRINRIRRKIALLVPRKSKKILEIGAGTGSQITEIKKRLKNSDCFAIDSSKGMLKIAKQKAKNLDITFIKKDFSKLGFPKNYFDVVVASLAIHEVSVKKQKTTLSEIYRVLKRNGKLIAFDFEKSENLFWRIAQTILFSLFEEYAEDFLLQKEKLFSNFKKIFFKRKFGILAIEVYEK